MVELLTYKRKMAKERSDWHVTRKLLCIESKDECNAKIL